MTHRFRAILLIAVGSTLLGVGRAEAQVSVRVYRRAPLPPIAVYVGPRYADLGVVPGRLAPWGSIPPHFYAASYPLPLFPPPPPPGAQMSFSYGRETTPYRPSIEPRAELYDSPADSPSADADIVAPEAPPPPQGIEAIPAPPGVDMPDSDGDAALAGPSGPVGSPRSIEQPSIKTVPTRRYDEGPREF